MRSKSHVIVRKRQVQILAIHSVISLSTCLKMTSILMNFLILKNSTTSYLANKSKRMTNLIPNMKRPRLLKILMTMQKRSSKLTLKQILLSWLRKKTTCRLPRCGWKTTRQNALRFRRRWVNWITYTRNRKVELSYLGINGSKAELVSTVCPCPIQMIQNILHKMK